MSSMWCVVLMCFVSFIHGKALNEKNTPSAGLTPLDFVNAKILDKYHPNEDDFPESSQPNGDRSDLFEGDIKGLLPSVIKSYSKAVDAAKTAGAFRTALVNPFSKWPGGIIPYELGRFSTNDRAVIAQAIQDFHDKTCVRFVERTTESDYVYITSLDGCWSYPGKVGGRQYVSLDSSGCIKKGVIIHELLHVTDFKGFLHEQSRTDRNEYVTVNLENVKPGLEANFDKYPTSFIDDLGVSYDYNSVLHYGRTYFSKNGKETITPKDPSAKIGQRKGFSDLDIERVNRHYECSAKTTATTTTSPAQTTTTTDRTTPQPKTKPPTKAVCSKYLLGDNRQTTEGCYLMFSGYSHNGILSCEAGGEAYMATTWDRSGTWKIMAKLMSLGTVCENIIEKGVGECCINN